MIDMIDMIFNEYFETWDDGCVIDLDMKHIEWYLDIIWLIRFDIIWDGLILFNINNIIMKVIWIALIIWCLESVQLKK